MPVATRARPWPSSASEMRSAVSAVVRTTSAERAAAGAGAAPRAARMRSFSAGQADGDPDRVRNAADDEALLLEPVGSGRRRPGRGRSSRADGGQSKPAASSASRIRSRSATVCLDVEPGVAQRGRGDPGRGRGDRSGVAAPVELARDLGRGDRVARRAAPRGRTPSTACGSRSGSASRAISGTTVSPPYSKYASSTTTAASGSERGERGDLLRLDAARRSGCSGCRPRRDRASAGLEPATLGALDPARDRVQRVGRRLRRRRAGRARGTSAPRARSGRPRRRRRRSGRARRPHRPRPPRAARGTCPPGTRSAARSSRRAAPAARRAAAGRSRRSGSPGPGGARGGAATSSAVEAQT